MRHTSDILAGLEERELGPLASAVASRHHVTLEEVLSPTRIPPAPAARAALWCELAYLGWSHTRIAQLFGCNHSTISTAVKATVERRVAAGVCPRCAGDRRRPGSDEPCPICNGVGAAKEAS